MTKSTSLRSPVITITLLCCLLVSALIPSAHALEKATIQLKWLHHFQFAGYYAALEKGFYRNAGLDVSILEGGPTTEVEKNVAEGRVDFGVGTSALLLNRANGQDLVVLAQIFQHSPAIFLAPRKTGIRTVADMAGRRFMYSNQHGDMLALLKMNGIGESGITMVPHEGDARDLINGKADVMLAYSFNEPFILEQAGEPYLSFSPMASGIDFYGDNVFTTRKLAVERSRFVAAFREATLQGWRYALVNKAEIADLILAKYSRQKNREWLLFEANQMETLIQPDLVELGYQSPVRWQRIAETFIGLGMLPKSFDPGAIIYTPVQRYDYRPLSAAVLLFSAIIAGLVWWGLSYRRLNKRLSVEIDERRIVEEALRESVSFNEQIISSAQEGIIVYDRNLRYQVWNPYMERLTGIGAADVIGKRIPEIFPFLQEVGVTERLERILAGGEVDPVEFPFALPETGKSGFVSDLSAPLRSKDGDIIGVIGTVSDIAERKRTEEALRCNNDFLRESQRVGRIGSYDYDICSGVWTSTETLDNILGIGADYEHSAKGWLAVVDPEYREQMEDYLVHLVINLKQPFDREYPIRRIADGERRWVHGYGKLHFDQTGTPVRMIGTIQDVTERRRMEEERVAMEHQLLKNQKIESLGVLAGGIAHDFNNILTGIMGNISFAQMFIDPSHRSFPILTQAEKASQRAAGLAQQLLTFARGSQPIKIVTSVQGLLDESVALVLSGSNVSCSCQIADDIRAIEVDEGQLSQTFNNVIINAAQAMPQGGTLKITAENLALAEGNALALGSGDYVRVLFTDMGCGISEEALKNVFDPYFTTKEGGNGLGLASAYSIVSKHKGIVKIHSREGVGTTVEIILPAASRSAMPEAEKPVGRTAGVLGTVSVLVMDDEPMIRELVADMLGDLGCQVQTCINGNEAVSLYRAAFEAGSPYSVVIMDLTVPGGMGGKEAARLILEIDRQARLIVSSGYSTDPVMADFAEYGFCATMVKPYNCNEIAQVLNDVLVAGEAVKEIP